jgi:hypothetical protein
MSPNNMDNENSDNQVIFYKKGHFWFDSGLVGLLILIRSIKHKIKIIFEGNKVILKGQKNDIQEALENAYMILRDRSYNISTQKQINERSSYNFYYDSKTDSFCKFPRKKSRGIAEIIYNKAPRPIGSSVKWAKKGGKVEFDYKGKKIKRVAVQLPESHAHLQYRLDEFLNDNEINVTTSGLLIDGPYAVQPKVNIKANSKSKKIKGNCYFCGESAAFLEEVSQTVYPLITGSSGVLSFNSNASKPEKVCWKCSLLGKFVPIGGFYYTSGDNIFAYFPYSSSLEKMIDVYEPLHEAEYQDPNYYRNFDHNLGGYFQHHYEVTFAFLYSLYKKVLLHQKGDEEQYVALDWNELYDLTTEKAPLEYFTLHARKEGQTFSVKSVWPFKESVYIYCLFDVLEKNNVMVKEIMRLLVDYDEKNENMTLVRNRVCERVLRKKSVLDLIEIFIYQADLKYLSPLLEFLIIYEQEIRGNNSMTKEEQDAAVKLGRRIGTAVGKSSDGKRGDLFALRKSRKKIDFLEQINRLQFKLGSELVIPADVYEGRLTNENFDEFKQFCMIAALNSFNAATSKEKQNKEA